MIVLAYNIENYIGRCLNTIINQTFNNLEIIVINDGSTDNTIDEIKKIAQNDDRIIVINNKNKGVIESRKEGFERASGEYILYVDGDDWIELNTVEILYRQAKTKNYDIVCYDYSMDSDSGRVIQNGKLRDLNDCTGDFLKDILLDNIPPSMWSKFIKRKFIEENKIKWPSGISYGEDLATVCLWAIFNPKIIYIDNKLYHYYQRENSITRKISNKILDISKATNYIKNELESFNLLPKYKLEFEYLIFLHNYYYQFGIISNFESKYSKKLYIIWKEFNIGLKGNRYIMNKLRESSKGQIFYYKLLNFNYNFAKRYSDIRGF